MSGVDLWIDVAVGDKDVESAVVIDVDEGDAPAETMGVDAEAGGIGWSPRF